MLLLDVNVVLAAHRVDHPHHRHVRSWFDQTVGADEPFAVPAMVWASFLRLATNRRVFNAPTSREDAFAFIVATSAQPSYALIGPGRRHLVLLRSLCDEGDATGDLVPDAVLGAIAIEHDCELVTLDRDFARLPSVRHLRLSAT